MAKIMVIAGGDWQIELIKKAKKLGHTVICSNLYKDSPAFPYSDFCEVANVLDKETNLKIAQKYQPDAIISDQSDIAVPTVAYLNEKMGLRGIGTELASLFSDKSKQRVFCKKHGISVPDFKLCSTYEEAASFFENYEKAIIKPIDSQSSRGVFTITKKEDIKEHMEETLAWSNCRKQFLIEQYVSGDEFTIDGMIVNGKYHPMTISIKEMYEQNPNVSRMQTYSYKHPVYDYDQMREQNRLLIETAGLPFGLCHSEYKCENGRFYLIESGARGGGSNLSGKIVPFMSGLDNYEFLIRQALDEKIDLPVFDKEYLENHFSIMRFFDFGVGTVDKVNGKEVLESTSNMIDFQLNVKPGQVLEPLKFGRMRPGHFIIGGTDFEALKIQMTDILDKVRVTFKK